MGTEENKSLQEFGFYYIVLFGTLPINVILEIDFPEILCTTCFCYKIIGANYRQDCRVSDLSNLPGVQQK